MNPGFITLLLGQIVAGMGIMGATRTRMPRSIVLPVAFLLGMFVHSVLFFGVDLFRLGLNDTMLIAPAFWLLWCHTCGGSIVTNFTNGCSVNRG